MQKWLARVAWGFLFSRQLIENLDMTLISLVGSIIIIRNTLNISTQIPVYEDLKRLD